MAIIGRYSPAIKQGKIKGNNLKGNSTPEFILGKPPLPSGYLPSIPLNSTLNYVEPDNIEEMGGRRTELGGIAYPIILGDKDSDTNTYIDNQGVERSYPTVYLDCALCTVDFETNVVMTKIQGLPKSIKEFISEGDCPITITGIYNSTQGVAPMDFIIALKAIFSANVPIPVTNYFLNAMDINYIVIMQGTQLPQLEGGYSTQTFTIKAYDDIPYTDILP